MAGKDRNVPGDIFGVQVAPLVAAELPIDIRRTLGTLVQTRGVPATSLEDCFDDANATYALEKLGGVEFADPPEAQGVLVPERELNPLGRQIVHAAAMSLQA